MRAVLSARPCRHLAGPLPHHRMAAAPAPPAPPPHPAEVAGGRDAPPRPELSCGPGRPRTPSDATTPAAPHSPASGPDGRPDARTPRATSNRPGAAALRRRGPSARPRPGRAAPRHWLGSAAARQPATGRPYSVCATAPPDWLQRGGARGRAAAERGGRRGLGRAGPGLLRGTGGGAPVPREGQRHCAALRRHRGAFPPAHPEGRSGRRLRRAPSPTAAVTPYLSLAASRLR